MTATITKSRASEVRRQLRADGCVDRLYVNHVEGTAWVASSYWAAPLGGNVAGLIIDSAQPGTYRLAENDKGTPVEHQEQTPPALDRVIPDYSTHVDLVPACTCETIHAYTADGYPIFTVGQGQPVAVNPAYVACVAPGAIGNGSETPGWGDPRVILRGNPDKPLTPLSVWRELVSTHQKHGRKVSYVFAGIVMPVRVGK